MIRRAPPPAPERPACPASAKSATHSPSRGRKSGRHKYLVASFQSIAEIPRLASSTSRALRYTSQQTSNANSALTPIAPPLECGGLACLLQVGRRFLGPCAGNSCPTLAPALP